MKTVATTEPLPLDLDLRGRHLDQPKPGSVEGPFVLAGWVLTPLGPPEGVAFTSDGVLLGEVQLDRLRPDVAAEYPDVPRADASGFAFRLSDEKLAQLSQITVEAILKPRRRAPFWHISLSDPGEEHLDIRGDPLASDAVLSHPRMFRFFRRH